MLIAEMNGHLHLTDENRGIVHKNGSPIFFAYSFQNRYFIHTFSLQSIYPHLLEATIFK